MDDRFRRAQDDYFVLRGQLETGRVTREQFDAALKQLMIQDAQGRFWMLGADSGRWYVHDGQNWVEAQPPSAGGYVPPPPPMAQAQSYSAPRSNILFLALGSVAVVCLFAAVALLFATSQGILKIGSSPTATLPLPTLAPTTPPTPVVLYVTATPGATLPLPTIAPPTAAPPTATPTPAYTRTPKPLPAGRANLPATITLKYDDAVPQEMRDEIEKGMALAYETLGQAGPVTVLAYANLDALIAEQARLIGRAIDSPTIVLNKKNFASGNTIAQANASTISVYAAGGWKNTTSAYRIQSLVHEYFHVLQSLRSQATFSADLGPKWLVEGTARYVENHTAAAYGLLKVEDTFRDALIAGAAFRNPLQSLETENGATLEDYGARYPLGYLGVEFLVSRYGEDGILVKFWQAMATAPTWQDAFTQAIGISPDEFYRQFEAYRLAQFAPVCGDMRTTVAKPLADLLNVRFMRQSAPGALTLSYATYSRPPNIAYLFCFDGVKLSDALPLAPKLKLPTDYAGWQSLYPNVIIVYMKPGAAPGEYSFGIDLGDKGKAETKFPHTLVTTVATPVPLIAPSPAPPRTPAATTTPSAPASVFGALSASKFAFVTDRDGNEEIYTVNSDGTQPTRLTNHAARDFVPAWSPDGRWLAFASLRDGNTEIYTMNADGSGLTRLTNNQNTDSEPSWSPDGSRLAFHSYRDGNWEIYAMNADGSAQTRITNDKASDSSPDWSPDGRRLVFASNRDGYDALYIMNSDGTNPVKLIGSREAAAYSPQWSPDGKRIAYVSRAAGNWEIHLVNADGGGDTRLTNTWGASESPSWSSDGNWIVFTSDRSIRYDIYAIKPDGSQTVRVTNLRGGDNRAPVLQPAPRTLPTPAAPIATSTPTAPAAPPGVYVTAVRTDPTQVMDGQFPTFQVTFLNTLGGAANYNWFVKIYEPDKKQSFGETPKVPSEIPVGSNTLPSSNKWKAPGASPCRQFIARVFYQAPDGTIVEFAKPGGDYFYYYFSVCQ